jgi:osmotically-inducible protein OsmY
MIHKILAAFLALFLLQAVCPAKDPPQITDDTISDAVRVKLAGDQLVGVLNLDVTVKQGVVTLAGSVDQKGLKSRAEKVARKVKGVKQVVNNIEVKPRTSGK